MLVEKGIKKLSILVYADESVDNITYENCDLTIINEFFIVTINDEKEYATISRVFLLKNIVSYKIFLK